MILHDESFLMKILFKSKVVTIIFNNIVTKLKGN